MRVLLGVGNYPKLSESYIEAEIAFLQRRGVEVAVHSQVVGSPEAPERIPVFRGSATEALSSWRPKVFHAHYVTFSAGILEQVGRAGVPVTVRGHSFDFSVEGARRVASLPYVKRVWLFPHFAELVRHAKIASLPVAFDSTLYRPVANKDRRLVYRTGAGKHGKGLPDFFDVARLCPEHRFRLAVNIVLGDEGYLTALRRLAGSTRTDYLENVSRERSVDLMGEAGIYLDTSDPKGHPFGMPISIAEALATGCYVLARSSKAVEGYLAGAGAVYSSVEEAAALIRATIGWSDEEWMVASKYAVEASQRFRDDQVLGEEVSFWETL